jgi:disulfide bond formation protein DsbB
MAATDGGIEVDRFTFHASARCDAVCMAQSEETVAISFLRRDGRKHLLAQISRDDAADDHALTGATMTPEISRALNALGLLIVSGILIGGFYFTIAWDELPCPLCLLQRVGFVAVGLGLALNLIYGPRPSHYGIMMIGAIYGGAVAIRQILLHIVPGTGSYGSPVLGLHFYTWSGIFFALILVGTALMLLFDRQFARVSEGASSNAPDFGGSAFAKFAFAVIVLVTAADAVSALLECGPYVCDDPPTSYKFLDQLTGKSL